MIMPKRIRLITLNPAINAHALEPMVHVVYEDDDGRASGTYLAAPLLGEALMYSGWTADLAVVDNRQPDAVQSLDGTLPVWTPADTPT